MNQLNKNKSFDIANDFQAMVTKLEADIKSNANGVDIIAGTNEDPIVRDSDKIPIKNFFMDGVYVREMTMYKGTAVVGAIHKHLHMCFLLEGHLTVASRGGTKDYKAPCFIISEPGEKRVLYSHEDSKWYNVHKNPDNLQEEDIIELEKQIVAISYEEYEQYKNTILWEW